MGTRWARYTFGRCRELACEITLYVICHDNYAICVYVIIPVHNDKDDNNNNNDNNMNDRKETNAKGGAPRGAFMHWRQEHLPRR